MDAMILAAGLGTRLRPLTEHTPKALVTVGGVPMLERIAKRLIEAGADRLIVNVHHHAEQVKAFIADRDGFGVDVRVSEEHPAVLETGGGLLHARGQFREEAPFLLHNVDVISDASLEGLYRAHVTSGDLVTLAVSDRDSSRLLRFDELGLQARVDRQGGTVEEARPAVGPTRERAFAGIHAISPEFFDLLGGPGETGVFSIIAPYLRLAGEGHRIGAYDIGRALWLEVGDAERLERARRFFRRGNGSGEE